MKVRYSCLLAAAAFSLAAEGSPAFAQQQPAAHEQVLITLPDFDWVRVRYGTPQQRAEWQRGVDAARQTARRRTAAVRLFLREHGMTMRSDQSDSCYGDETCLRLLWADRVTTGIGSWERFEAAWAEARPAAAAVLNTVSRAGDMMATALGGGLESELQARFLRDQLLRAAYSDQEMPLSPDARSLFGFAMAMMMNQVDRINAAWLRRTLAESGWPRPPRLSERAEMAAWFMLVHARHDPELRFSALEMMREASERGELSRASYATRLDHLMEEYTGIQRYGTKGECRDGRFVPAPVEREDQLAGLRRKVGLPTIEEQVRTMAAACAPAG